MKDNWQMAHVRASKNQMAQTRYEKKLMTARLQRKRMNQEFWRSGKRR